MSPIVFNIYVMGMVDELERSNLGVTLGGKWCRGLLYGDGITFLAETGPELQLILSFWEGYAARWKLNFNVTRVKCMLVGKGDTEVRKSSTLYTYIHHIGTFSEPCLQIEEENSFEIIT